MDITPRSQQILRVLLDSRTPVGKQEIAERIGVSKRTVQREFEDMDRVLKPYGLRLRQRKGTGVSLEGTDKALQDLREQLAGNKDIDAGNREARRKRLLFEMLRDRTPHKLFYYSELLGVSEGTVAADMDALCPWLEESRLGIIRRPGYGVILEGQERDYRQAMRRFMEENAGSMESGRTGELSDMEGLRDLGGDDFIDALLNAADRGIYSLLSQDTVRRVDRVLKELEEPRILQLADRAYAGLVIHISIVIERLRQGAALENIPPELGDLEFWDEYETAVRILEAMEREFSLEIPRGELSYVLLHIRGAKVAYSGGDRALRPDLGDERLLEIIDRMIDAYDCGVADSLREDEEFLRGLLIHLRPVLVRLRSGMHIHNPVLEDIRAEYPEVLKASERAAAVLEQETGCRVSIEETGFLAMHFGAAQERLREQSQYTRRVLIGIVCASGFGVARLMMSRLSTSIGDRAILRAYGRGEIDQHVMEGTDFFVSTLNLDSLPVDYIRVAPLIPPGDLELIEGKINDYSHLRRETAVVRTGRKLDEIWMVGREIKGMIRRYRRMETAPNVRFREILQFMAMQVTESLHAAASLREAVEEREKVSSQIMPDLGIALLHCRTGAVREPVFVTCTPRGGGPFTDPFFKGIRTAALLVMPMDRNRALHAEVLGSISGAFITNRFFLDLVKYGTEEAVRTELARELKCFFFDYVDRSTDSR